MPWQKNEPRPLERLMLADAKRAVRSYDGSEDAFDRLIRTLAVFEASAKATFPHAARDRAETALASALGSSRSMTIDALLDFADHRYRQRTAEGAFPLAVSATPFTFLPSAGHHPIQPGEAPRTSFEAPRIQQRVRRFLAELTAPGAGVFREDIEVHTGQPQPGAMRTEAYALIQLPRHDREVLICDQVGNASFVGKGIRGPLFWASYRKEQLRHFQDVTRVVNGPGSDARLIDLILRDNPPGPKVSARSFARSPLTEDLILTHALRYAETHEGRLPTGHTGDVEGLPGEKWLNWHYNISRKGRTLSREGVTGLSHLFQIYGLKSGRRENPEAIARAIRTLNETGHHGLQARPPDSGRLTEDMILIDGLRHAEADAEGRLPTHDTRGDIPGRPGQTWTQRQQALIQTYRGLTREGVKGLSHFFWIYGLKTRGENGQFRDDPEAIARALRTLNETGHHGLTPKVDLGLPRPDRVQEPRPV